MNIEWLWVAAIALIVIGMLGLVVPGVPGVMAIFGGMLLAAWIDDFQKVTVLTLVILGCLTALAFVADIVGGLLGAKRVGASRQALIGAALGCLLGLPFGLLGLVVGPFAGAVAGELLARRSMPDATRVGFATWLGLAVGTLAKIALAVAMLATFIIAWLVD